MWYDSAQGDFRWTNMKKNNCGQEPEPHIFKTWALNAAAGAVVNHVWGLLLSAGHRNYDKSFVMSQKRV